LRKGLADANLTRGASKREALFCFSSETHGVGGDIKFRTLRFHQALYCRSMEKGMQIQLDAPLLVSVVRLCGTALGSPSGALSTRRKLSFS
jgi:hypothetical protein